MSTIGNTNTSYGYRDWWNENKYKDPSEWTAPPTDGTSGTTNWGVKFEEDDKAVKVEDFLNLMVAQLQNQDFMNPVDDTQYVTQLAQFAPLTRSWRSTIIRLVPAPAPTPTSRLTCSR